MAEIVVVPKDGQGHLFPCMELCAHLLRRNYKITVLVDSDVSSSIPSSLTRNPLFQFHRISPPPPPPGSESLPPFIRQHLQMTLGIEEFLLRREPSSTRPVCAVIDHIMNKTQEAFWKLDIPTVIFITSGACWAAVQHAAWVVRPGDMKPGEVRALPGLPDEMVLSYSDLKQRRHFIPSPPVPRDPQAGGSKPFRGPPLPGQPAPWVEEVQRSAAILINTCDDLERPFLDYVAELTRKPVWGVGPLLPEQFWQSTDSVLRDRQIRPKRESNYSEDQVMEWLNSKPVRSVIYVSFGSEVGPTMEEYPELAEALEKSTRPFIWVIQKTRPVFGGTGMEAGDGYFPDELVGKVGERGMIIHGWAPQLLILTHPSTGGFVTHCGWNSTVEAMTRGVPLLAWPIRGDQYFNAKLVVSHLRVGCMISDGYPADTVNKDDITQGMEKILTDEGIRKRSADLGDKFANGFPASSMASLDAFGEFINLA